MVELSEEIIANIISQLPDPQAGQDPRTCGLAQYATVSRSWQEGVEARTFAHLTLTPERLASPLAAQVLTPNRVHRFVRSVEVNTTLPPYNEEARKRVEDKDDKLANNRVFTDIIRKTFTLLSSNTYNTGNAQTQERQLGQGVDPPAPYRPKIKLSLTASCLSDQQDWQGRQWRSNVSAISTGDIFEARYESSYLDLSPDTGRTVQDEAEALPELVCISEFQVEGTARRYFAPRALCLMASRMRGLRSLKLELYDNEKRDFALRKILRSGRLIDQGYFVLVYSFPFLVLSSITIGPFPSIWLHYTQSISLGTKSENRLRESPRNATKLTGGFSPRVLQT